MCALRIEPASLDEWRSCLASDRWATAFQTPEWWDVAPALHRGHRTVAFRLSWPGRTVVVPALVQESRLLGSTMLASPAGTYGGWVGGALNASQASEVARWGCSFGQTFVRPNPYRPEPAPAWGTATPDVTHVLDLARPLEEVRAGFRKGHRYNARAAVKRGIVVREGKGPGDWAHYQATYLDSVGRWGDRARLVHRPALFEALSRQPSSRVRLWLAEHEGRVAAGAVLLRHGTHVTYWHGASRRELMHTHAATLLQDVLIEDAHANGVLRYDFNPSGGLEGVLRFKEGFGAVPLSSPVYRHAGWRARLAALAKRREPADAGGKPAEPLNRPVGVDEGPQDAP